MIEKYEKTYFETIKCDDYEVFNLEYHKKRISNTIGMNFNLEEYIYPPDEKLYRCKLIYSKDEVLDISYFPYSIKPINSFKLVFDDNIEYRYKYLDRENIDRLSNLKSSEDEVIIIKNEFVTDTSIANIAILLDDEKWYTPRTPLLYGTTRDRYLESENIKELDIDVNMLKKARKIALMNAMIDFKILDEFSIN
jgi:4-amino-4-deoxychorismate lyase